jgi:hypothetical protein
MLCETTRLQLMGCGGMWFGIALALLVFAVVSENQGRML